MGQRREIVVANHIDRASTRQNGEDFAVGSADAVGERDRFKCRQIGGDTLDDPLGGLTTRDDAGAGRDADAAAVISVRFAIEMNPKSGCGAQTVNATVSPGATGKFVTRTAGLQIRR